MTNRKQNQDQFGFIFWLKWILWFVGSFILSAVFWTALLSYFFGSTYGKEITITWSIAVFGTWFLIVIPFMRKKEQIWKRLNLDEERAVDTWLKGMGSFLALIIASCFIWSFVYSKEIVQPHAGVHTQWLKLTIGSWLVLSLPFLIFLYRQADAIFKGAAKRQTENTNKFKSTFIEKEARLLPKHLLEKLQSNKPLMKDGYIVNLKLKTGREISNVFVRSEEILGIYDAEEMDFSNSEIDSLEPLALESLPAYDEEKWLRLDGRA